MAKHLGKEGSITVDGDAVGELTSFQLDESVVIVDDTALGLTWAEHSTGIKSWSGNLAADIDPADTAQAALVNGASVALVLFVEGTATGKERHSGTATLSNVSRAVTGNNEHSTLTCDFTGNGAKTIDTVP